MRILLRLLLVVAVGCVVTAQLIAADEFEDSLRKFLERKKAACGPCPKGSKHVLTTDLEVECMPTQKGMEQADANVLKDATQAANNSTQFRWSIKQPQLVEEGVPHDLRSYVPELAAQGLFSVVVLQVESKALFKAASCNMKIFVHGTLPQEISSYEAYSGPVASLLSTSFVLVPVDSDSPIISWNAENISGCDTVGAVVTVLGVHA